MDSKAERAYLQAASARRRLNIRSTPPNKGSASLNSVFTLRVDDMDQLDEKLPLPLPVAGEGIIKRK